MTNFGGTWTEEKLERVTAYLAAYQNVMKNQNLRTVYIDGFCGDGTISMKGDDDNLAEEGRRIITGSATRALQLATPFAEYHFIDRSATSVEALKAIAASIQPGFEQRVHTHAEDVNAALPRIVNSLNNRTDRAVVFVDPFGMQLDWSTVQAVAAKPIVDFWYLVPIGIAVNRLATKNADRMSEAWGKRLDAFLGTSTWRTEWYAPSPQPDLFVTAPTMERQVNIDKIEEFFHKRLGEAFHRVAPNKLQLGASPSKPLYTLMFACSNPSDRAFGAALRIANHLLKS